MGNNVEWEEQAVAACIATPVATPLGPSTAGQGNPETLAVPVDVWPTLQDLDVIHAVQMARPGQAELIADTLISTFRTDLNRGGVLSIILLLGPAETYGYEMILQSFLSGLSPSEILSKVTRLTEYFGEVHQGE